MSVLFFTEQGTRYGFGHFSRCLAIAEALSEHWHKSLFVIDFEDKTTESYTRKNFPELSVIKSAWQKDKSAVEVAIQKAGEVKAVVVDSYHATLGVLQYLALMGRPILYLDDYKRLEYPRGIIVNPSPKALKERYIALPSRRVYSGLDYMPLRHPFWDKKAVKYLHRSSILVTLGGTRCEDALKRIAQALASTREEVRVVYPLGKLGLKGAAETGSLSAEEFAEELGRAKIAVVGGGTSLSEAARLGTPAVAVKLADNQNENIKVYTEEGFARYAGTLDGENLAENTVKLCEELKNLKAWKVSGGIGLSMVDGQGARRIAHILAKEIEGLNVSKELKRCHNIGGYECVSFINLKEEELRRVHAARNSNRVLKVSVNQKEITFEQQSEFVESLKNSLSSGYWLVKKRGREIGVVTLTAIDYYQSECDIGFYKFEEVSEKGVGAALLELGKRLAFKKLELQAINALCYEDNQASIKSLERAGFTFEGYRETLVGSAAKIRRYGLSK